MAANQEIVNNFLAQESGDEDEPDVDNFDIQVENPNGNANAGDVRQREEENVNENRNVQRRNENILPLSQTDPRNRIPRRYTVRKASIMVNEDCPRHHIYAKFLLMRVNSGNEVGKEEKYVYQYRKQGKSVSNSGSYGRLFLLMDLEDESGTLYYLIQSTAQHGNLWNFNRSIRDNGDITIGTILCVLNPRPIERYMAGQIPIIETDHPVVTLQSENLRTINMRENLPSNETIGFCVKNVPLSLLTLACIPGRCSGYFCDRQRVKELVTLKKGCGCYYTGRNSSIVVKFELSANVGETVLEISDFTSYKFQQIFMNGRIPIGAAVESFCVTSLVYENLYDNICEVIDFINTRGGWTIVGWSKRGEINDVSPESTTGSATEKVEAPSVSHHIVRIFPTNRNINIADNMLFNVSSLI